VDVAIAVGAEKLTHEDRKPKSVIFVDELPLTAYGRIDKKLMCAPIGEGQQPMVR
jgi:non-ribosomal peptide synthetase component E (peptide arylation enzyme)